MVTRRLGTHGPEISVLGIGTWAFSGPYQHGWGPADDADSIAAIRHAIASGVNWVDTAAVYGLGRAEEVVGRAIQPFCPGEDVFVFTKCGRRVGESGGNEIVYDLRPQAIRAECDESLRRLGIERIDLYQFHWPDYGTGTPLEESWATMVELVAAGKVRWLGVCNFSVELLERCEAMCHVDSLQPPLSLLNHHARAELIPWCLENGTGVIVYSPLASGLLTGRFSHARMRELAPDDWRRFSPAFQDPRLSRALDLVERLRPLAERLGCELPALAVAWTLAAPGVTGAIVGARRPAQLDAWLPAAELELDDEITQEIERLTHETGAAMKTAPLPPISPPPR
jgi:aryl-alcohol dehydrogenase-like predicted oxidoreductase